MSLFFFLLDDVFVYLFTNGGSMTVAAILTEVGSAMTLVLPDLSVILMAAIVIGTVVFVGSVLYRRLRR